MNRNRGREINRNRGREINRNTGREINRNTGREINRNTGREKGEVRDETEKAKKGDRCRRETRDKNK